VILRHFYLGSRANQRLSNSGMDDPRGCLDLDHYNAYPHTVEYSYNSRGFRDHEWPTDFTELTNSIWCVGDSFTVGLGQPFDHIWPQVLEKRIGKRCINISMDGASNDWIARHCHDIIKIIQPKNVVIMWSYTHRREDSSEYLTDEARRLHAGHTTWQQDLDHWVDLVHATKKLPCHVIHTTVPDFHVEPLGPTWQIFAQWNKIRAHSWPIQPPQSLTELYSLPESIKHELVNQFECFYKFEKMLSCSRPIIQFDQIDLPSDVLFLDWPPLDFARDGHHFGIKTSESLVDYLVERLKR